MNKTVAIGGLGAIGLPLARALDEGIQGLTLIAVAARDHAKAEANLTRFRAKPRIVPLDALAEADIVVEAAPAAAFEQIAWPAIEAGRIFVPASVGALLPRMHLVARAQVTGARVVVPTGALLGLDAVRAAAEGPVDSVTMVTRKPPGGLAGAPYLKQHGIEVSGLTEPLRCSRATHSTPPRASRPTSTSPPRWRWPGSVRCARGWRSGPTPASPATPHTITRGGRSRALQHDHRERAKRGQPAHRQADRAVGADLPARPGIDAEGRKLTSGRTPPFG